MRMEKAKARNFMARDEVASSERRQLIMQRDGDKQFKRKDIEKLKIRVYQITRYLITIL
jgi:hypothetical protein